MTQRSMLAGPAPIVVIPAGGNVIVEGWESDRVQAESDRRWGLELEKRQATSLGRERARAAIGERVLFDVSFDNPFSRKGRLTKDLQGEVIAAKLYGDGKVRVPVHSEIVVYAGHDVEVRHIQGRVLATSGRDLQLRDVQVLAHAAAGGDLDIDCATLDGSEFIFGAGRDVRFFVHDLTDAHIWINEHGAYWEAILGDGRLPIRIKAGGDVTLVTDQVVKGQPPYFLLGNIERPAATSETTQQD